MNALKEINAERQYLNPAALEDIAGYCSGLNLKKYQDLLNASLLLLVDTFYQYGHMNQDVRHDHEKMFAELNDAILKMEADEVITHPQRIALQTRIKFNVRRYNDPVVLLAERLGRDITPEREDITANETLTAADSALKAANPVDIVVHILNKHRVFDYMPVHFNKFFTY